jgi:nitrate reductase gamma subunit
MSAAAIFFALVYYAAVLFFVVALGFRIYDYARTPAPLVIPTTPAPLTMGGVWLRMLREVTLFESLFKGNLWIWLFGWAFHVALALVLIRHLRYFTEPVWGWVVMLQPFGLCAGIVMAAGLIGLWARRFLLPQLRYVSTVSDHLMLALLVGIALTGLAMAFVSHTDVIAVKAYVLGLMMFDWQALPADALLYVHLALVAVLLVVFPYSKLLHAPGVFFSPGRNQAYNPREVRHLAPWAAELERKV